jgi:hypothetical protein
MTPRWELRGLAVLGAALFLAGCGASQSTGNAGSSTTTPKVTAASNTTATPKATVTPTPKPTATAAVAKSPAACQAVNLGTAGEWSQAQQHWLTAEEQASTAGDLTATLKLENLGSDTGALALDVLDGTSNAQDLATYKADLSSASAYTAHC